jgi:hypothetical protein
MPIEGRGSGRKKEGAEGGRRERKEEGGERRMRTVENLS